MILKMLTTHCCWYCYSRSKFTSNAQAIPLLSHSHILHLFLCNHFHIQHSHITKQKRLPFFYYEGFSLNISDIIWSYITKVSTRERKQLVNQNGCTAQKIKFFITDFFSKCNQICNFLRIQLYLLKKSVM